MSIPIGPIEPLNHKINFSETELGEFKEQDRFLPVSRF